MNINQIFTALSKDNPSPKTELDFTNNYTMLVAVVLSAQATDVGVNKATKPLFAKISTPEAMLQLGEDGLKTYIKSIGLFNSKAKNVILLSQQLVDKHNSEVPDSFDDLVQLPGVGRKTANVVLACAFGHPTIAVDTHVFRVSKRLGLANGNTPDKVEQELLTNIPDKWLPDAHHWLILHGRYTCKARKPECEKCIISQYCQDYNK